MKKFLSLLLILSFAFSLSACSAAATPSPEPTAEPTPEPTVTPTPEPVKDVHWTTEYYIDEFGDPTSDSYIRGIFEGDFSNSVTSGSELVAVFFMESKLNRGSSDMFSIRLLEYGNNKVNFIGCETWDVNVKVKVDGVVSEDNVDFIFEDTGEIVFERGNEIFGAVLNALDADKEISFLVEVEKNYANDTYRFSIDANGLSDIPHKWIGVM